MIIYDDTTKRTLLVYRGIIIAATGDPVRDPRIHAANGFHTIRSLRALESVLEDPDLLYGLPKPIALLPEASPSQPGQRISFPMIGEMSFEARERVRAGTFADAVSLAKNEHQTWLTQIDEPAYHITDICAFYEHPDWDDADEYMAIEEAEGGLIDAGVLNDVDFEALPDDTPVQMIQMSHGVIFQVITPERAADIVASAKERADE